MIPGSKGHNFHACMKNYDLETREIRGSSPGWADSEYFRTVKVRNAEQSVGI